MKIRISFLIICLAFCSLPGKVHSQSLKLSPELKELIELSLNKDRKVIEKDIDKQITEVQQKAVRSAYIPKVELGGKYLFAYSSVNSKMGDIEGFESLGKLQELMQSPNFPLMFPNMAGLAGEITKLQQLMV
jgi:hypothetical protein